RDAEHAPLRVEQVRLVTDRGVACRVAHLLLGVEDIVDREADLRAAQPRMLDDQVEPFAEIGEQVEVELRQRREIERSGRAAVDLGPALPVGVQARAEAVVEIASVNLKPMPRAAAAAFSRLAVEIVED